MSDQTYVFAGIGPPIYGNPVVVKESWPQWCKDLWVSVMAANSYKLQQPPWKPTYESVQVSWPGNNGNMQTIALEPLEFPTLDTCLKLAEMYAVEGKNLLVLEIPFYGLGPVTSTALNRLLQFPNGKTLPAFQLANYYTNNPEDKSSAADALCKLLIARVWPG